MTVSALFVETGGIYATLGCDVWGGHREGKRLVIDRDAREYDGPGPVIAHPPCERWGRYWSGGPSAKVKRKLGDDDGCFAAALAAVRNFGGVLEGPEASHAWKYFGLNRPPQSGGWVVADELGGLTCCVAQGHYGHVAQKLTWLYSYGVDPVEFIWGRCAGRQRLDPGFHSKAERDAAPAHKRLVKRLTRDQRVGTPEPFAQLLIDLVSPPTERELLARWLEGPIPPPSGAKVTIVGPIRLKDHS